jgi:hypothetical protein
MGVKKCAAAVLAGLLMFYSVSLSASQGGVYRISDSYANWPDEKVTDKHCQQFFDGAKIVLDSQGLPVKDSKFENGVRFIRSESELNVFEMQGEKVRVIKGGVERAASLSSESHSSSDMKKVAVYLPYNSRGSDRSLGFFIERKCGGFVTKET